MDYTDISILHTNDMHSYMENFPKKAQLIANIRDGDKKKGILTFVFDSGDLFSGNIFFNMYRGVKEIELMNQIGCQAMTLGNHEFDHGDELVPLEDVLEFDMNGNPLYVLGLTTLETQEVASPSENVIFEDHKQALRRVVDQVLAKDPQAHLVLLSHLGYDEDVHLAKDFPELNVILGGHTHTILKQPSQIGGVSICQAGQYGRFVGHLSLRCFADGRHEVLAYDLIEVEKLIQEDRVVKAIIDQMKSERDAVFSQPIAILPQALDGERDSIRQGLSTLAPVICQALFEQASQLGLQADGAVINGFGIRASLSAGPIFYSDLVKVLSFSKRVLLVRIKGRDLLSSLQTGLHPQMWGIVPGGEGFVVNGRAVESDKDYQIVTNSFVWSGKDNYDDFHKAEIVQDLGLDIDIISEFFKRQYGG
ncbi:TPA: 5'-nucleotidase C-terminal domain-containing protein [Streptococcus suis]|uniref:5'-nucleotidase/2',3'-cyclic phosphodiesterase and related esterases n=1 Tax=Streptococcus suis TaxID=1307 RepID=A0A0Z8BMT6_STRSU|nr:5'-nucleotidase C-terminal domain-containing protein [Streptococcus suis]MCK4042645.1 bifunctional metallophosphatase/5'-nucleotidase [Streptococcus suis]NQH92370.1 bifunctional metallophosphatase/5'-nucleotidase [Streptococcus suis]NQI12624.1 bifunctional metallophosphatase/5'-nucleotidase [Streptococcus suis]NQO09636.1 bifunctional metallophosphatase/5'-nucleotidase [Streptococcus suis]NQO72628.1 bifunctional metallophosphatase/5'-nucleotidase [Streptococcus suis]